MKISLQKDIKEHCAWTLGLLAKQAGQNGEKDVSKELDRVREKFSENSNNPNVKKLHLKVILESQKQFSKMIESLLEKTEDKESGPLKDRLENCTKTKKALEDILNGLAD